jgi:hypothetical protein
MVNIYLSQHQSVFDQWKTSDYEDEHLETKNARNSNYLTLKVSTQISLLFKMLTSPLQFVKLNGRNSLGTHRPP